ncbi:hypothetical protein HPHPP74_1579 [Helicobacter pylori Hp P-74]|nr:hypothetical protein HPHPH10_1131 [Helicobacter pylori Hp H-10]EJC16762.1 hypothetical protein HPHPP74_1579 [Helicobacter pylori Hp P-74]
MLRLTPLLITLKNLLAQALLYFNGKGDQTLKAFRISVV